MTRSTNGCDKTRSNSRTSNIQTTDYSNHSQNQEVTRNHSMFQWRHQRTHHRDDPTWADRHRHWRIRQANDNARFEQGSTADEATKCVHTSTHRYFDAGTTKEHHTKQMGILCNKGTEVRARIVAKGFSEPVIFPSTPIYSVLRLLLTLSLSNSWTVRIRDISVALLHAAAATDDLHMYPPSEFYNRSDGIVWKLSKAKQSMTWEAHGKPGKQI